MKELPKEIKESINNLCVSYLIYAGTLAFEVEKCPEASHDTIVQREELEKLILKYLPKVVQEEEFEFDGDL